MWFSKAFRREDLADLFHRLSAAYRQNGGTAPVDLYIVGGSAIIMRFHYRQSTIDVDAYYQSNRALSQAILDVSKERGLPKDWLNDEYAHSPSFSERIVQYAELDEALGDELIHIRLLPDSYLIAVKLKSSRPEGGDLDDIIRMIAEIRHRGDSITYEEIIEAYRNLYGDSFWHTYEFFLKEVKAITEMSDQEIEEQYYPKSF